METSLDALMDHRLPHVSGRGVLGIDSALQHSLGNARDATSHRRGLWCCVISEFTGLFSLGLAVGMLGSTSEPPRHVANIAACIGIQLRDKIHVHLPGLPGLVVALTISGD